MKKQHFLKALICSLALCTLFSLCGCGESKSDNTSGASSAASGVSTAAEDSSTDDSITDESTKDESTQDESTKDESTTDESSVSDYKDPEYTLGKIVDSGNCGDNGDNVKWELDENGLLVISGSGKMADYDAYGRTVWYVHKEKIKSIIVKKGITSIGEFAFSGLLYLNDIAIPDSVTRIGSWAFFCCSRLKSVTIPDTITSIEDYVFASCESLTNITIPDSVTSIGSCGFNGCRNSDFTIPESVTSVGQNAFSGLTSSQTISIKGKSEAPSGWNSNWNHRCDAKIVWNA